MSGHLKFMPQAKESNDLGTVTLPVYRGTSGKHKVWFVVTDASSKEWADRLGANFAPKLALAANTDAVMHVSGWETEHKGVDFPFTPDFAPSRVLDANAAGGCSLLPQGFLPIGPGCFQPGADGSYGHDAASATGQNSYSPLIQFTTTDGVVVLNAPQIKNHSGQADKILRLHEGAGTVDYVETAGFYDDHTIHYASFDSSNPLASTIENMTYAPAFGKAPGDTAGENLDGTKTSRAGIIAFTNGPTGLGNPVRQGLDSIILDGASAAPNVIQFTPADTDANGIVLYSPLWDVHLATWANPADATRMGLFEDVQRASNQPDGTPTADGPLAGATGKITAPGGGTFGPSGFDVNCPIISTDDDGVVIIPPPN